MKGCNLNNISKKGLQPKWVIEGSKRNPVQFIEWMHKTMSYKHHMRIKYSKNYMTHL